MFSRRMKSLATTMLFLMLAGCAVGPDYVRPSVEVPQSFKEVDGWKTAQPRDVEARGAWWEIFNDPTLNALEEQVNISNQNLAQAEANYRQAEALVRVARASYFPTVNASASGTRSATGVRAPVNAYNLSIDASWEADLWGKLRRTIEASRTAAQASAADIEAARLSAQAQLAQNYFQLRAVDSLRELLQRTVADYEKSLQLTKNQYAVGVAARENVILAQTQLQTTQAQAIDLGVQRAQLEHAIALLIGKPASMFSLPPAPIRNFIPLVPVSMPSELLERRPDIASAERQMASANAGIGVARSAFFPDLTISAAGGWSSSSFANWLTLPNRFWSLGPAVAQTLFSGGALTAKTDQAIAVYDANVAAYRQTVLTGFQEVEDNLAALRILEQEAQAQDAAVKSARLSVDLTMNQYKAGIVSYLNVITTQTTALTNEQTAVNILNRRLAACVLLIKALGGGWHASELPR